MKCPVDDATLMMTERSGVEIDYCPQCRGVWLDRGELDKILARAQAPEALGEPPDAPRRDPRDGHGEPAREQRPPRASPGASHGASHGDDRRAYGDKLGEWRDRDEDHHRKNRRKGFLGDLFDF